ncbi:hypothetical protein ACHAXA_011119 [Cyclostephanos tholiformis]|uniref:Uncharacterized protein n=1 Tax=Cyclostephanos tholiformis TaxID=382380 RepID=A0ABD3SEV4_9STRA
MVVFSWRRKFGNSGNGRYDDEIVAVTHRGMLDDTKYVGVYGGGKQYKWWRKMEPS